MRELSVQLLAMCEKERNKGSKVILPLVHACTSREVMVCFLLSAQRAQRVKVACAKRVALLPSFRVSEAEREQRRAYSAGTA